MDAHQQGMDPHYQAYADNNLNQKPADSSYIYNTEATYVTTITREQSMAQHIDINQQWTGNQSIQYQDPNPGYVQGVEPQYQQSVVVTQDNAYILQPDPNTPYITQQQTMETQEQHLYTMAQDGQQTTYVYQQAHVQENYGGQVANEEHYVQQEFRVENPQIQPNNPTEQQQSAPVEAEATTEVQIEEVPENEAVPQAEVVEPTDGIVVNVSHPEDNPKVTDPPQENVIGSSIVEVSEAIDESQLEGTEVIEDETLQIVQEEAEATDSVALNTEAAPMETEVTPMETQFAPMETEAVATLEEAVPTLEEADPNLEEAAAEEAIKPEQGDLSSDQVDEGDILIDQNMAITETEESAEQLPVTTAQPTHTPEQALGAMYEFSEESEGHVSATHRKVEVDKTNDPTNSEVKIEIQTENKSEVQLEETQAKPQEMAEEAVTLQKGKRGRKSKGEVPTHILGVDISKPVDNLPNGKAPKPRLGVKVPTRILTSHIVSKAEIEQEIVERGRRKMEARGQEAFTKKLSHRLAKQIAGDASIAESSSNGRETVPENRALIENNSDLLAILEGDDDDSPEMPVLQKGGAPEDPEEIRNLEREIALQQLKELPFMSPKTKFDRTKEIPGFAKPPKLHAEDKKPPSKKKPQEGLEKGKTQKKESSSSAKSDLNSSLEIEPQIKVNMALKTYSRKRKSVEPSEASPEKKAAVVPTTPVVLPAANPPTPTKIDCPVTTAAYVTKSSRVIKKKVIWDPDDELPSVVSSRTSAKITPKNEPPPEQNKSPTKPVKTYEKNEKTPVNKSEKLGEIPKVQEKKVDKTSSKEKFEKKEEKREEKEKSKIKESSVEKEKLTPKKQPPVAQIKNVSKTPKAKKSMSEVDKLLGDEGAIRMLYEMKNDGDGTDEKRKSKRNIISVEKTFKELAKQADEIKSSLVMNSTNNEVSPPKSLRKKDTSSPAPPPPPLPIEKPEKKLTTTPRPAPVLSRQKSKDSTRSSVHTPPASPAPSFEASYLIRRRSSSSISDLQDEDYDKDHDSDVEIKIPRKKTSSTPGSAVGTKIKKHKKHTAKQESLNTTVDSESEVSPAKVAKLDNRLGPFTMLSVKKINKQVTLTLELESTKRFLSIEVLEELTVALTKLSKERDCNVVLVRSSDENSFCLGLDYKTLIADKDSDRRAKASQLASSVSEFVKSLLHFPKVLVAGIQGECVGLGVTILPLFDLVVASDKACFSTNYCALGCVAEAGFLLTAPHITNHGLAAELLYSNQKLKADDAHRRGLVSKLCWPEKYQETIRNLVSAIAKSSKQSLEATKKQLRKGIMKSTDAAIDSMSKQLTDHWSSNECQKNFDKIDKVE